MTTSKQAAGTEASGAGKPTPSKQIQVCDTGDLKRYRTETPNLLYELRLTPFEFALYSHFKRVAGAGTDGRCFKSTDTLAEETEMSEGMISKAKKGLLRTDRPGLNGKALIRIEKDLSRPGRPRDIVTIVDVWPENFLFFARQSSPQSSLYELQSSPQSSPGECKNESESLKKELIEERSEEALNVVDKQGTPAEPSLEPQPPPTLNASPSDFANSSLFSDDSEAEHPEPKTDPVSTIPPPGSCAASSSLKAQEIERVVRLTGDEASRRRFEQLYDLAAGNGLLTLWDQSRKATHKALQAKTLTGPPGAYFNGVAAKLLNEAHPALVPTGTPKERREVHGLARSSLAAADANSAESKSAEAKSGAGRRERR